MSSFGLSPRRVIVAAAGSVLLALAVAPAAAAPSSDSQGYTDSTARCSPPDTAVAFGSTQTSRVAICRTPGGEYEYRGVRVRDGARLIVPATSATAGTFVAENNGVTYTLTSTSLIVRAGGRVIREEPMVDFHQPETPETPTGPSAPTAPAPPSPPSPAPTTPLPPPLPAEAGGSGG